MKNELKNSILKLLQSESHQIGFIQWFGQGGTKEGLVDLILNNTEPYEYANKAFWVGYRRFTLGDYLIGIHSEIISVFDLESCEFIPMLSHILDGNREDDLDKIKRVFNDLIKQYINKYQINLNNLKQTK